MKTFFALTTGLLSGFMLGIVAYAWANDELKDEDATEVNDEIDEEPIE